MLAHEAHIRTSRMEIRCRFDLDEDVSLELGAADMRRTIYELQTKRCFANGGVEQCE
jgi:hypothetical protein